MLLLQEASNAGLIATFFAGVFSFLSPCVIPLIPMYVGFLAGDYEADGSMNKKRLLINSIAFLAGLLIIFSLLGLSISALSEFFAKYRDYFTKGASVIIIIFGIVQLGIIAPSFMQQTKRLKFKGQSGKIGSAFLLGMAFGFGWTPCMGPILGATLLMASTSGTILKGVLYLVAYSVGFSIPFLITTFLVEPIMKLLEGSGKAFKVIKVTLGIIMIVIGVLMYMGKFNL